MSHGPSLAARWQATPSGLQRAHLIVPTRLPRIKTRESAYGSFDSAISISADKKTGNVNWVTSRPTADRGPPMATP